MIAAEVYLIQRAVAEALRSDIAGPIRCHIFADLAYADDRLEPVRAGIDRWIEAQAAAITTHIVAEIDQQDARRALDARKRDGLGVQKGPGSA